jgi:hypothetical protein
MFVEINPSLPPVALSGKLCKKIYACKTTPDQM